MEARQVPEWSGEVGVKNLRSFRFPKCLIWKWVPSIQVRASQHRVRPRAGQVHRRDHERVVRQESVPRRAQTVRVPTGSQGRLGHLRATLREVEPHLQRNRPKVKLVAYWSSLKSKILFLSTLLTSSYLFFVPGCCFTSFLTGGDLRMTLLSIIFRSSDSRYYRMRVKLSVNWNQSIVCLRFIFWFSCPGELCEILALVWIRAYSIRFQFSDTLVACGLRINVVFKEASFFGFKGDAKNYGY